MNRENTDIWFTLNLGNIQAKENTIEYQSNYSSNQRITNIYTIDLTSTIICKILHEQLDYAICNILEQQKHEHG